MKNNMMKDVASKIEELKEADNLSVHDIFVMDMFEYHRGLQQRAWDIVRANYA